MTTIPGFPSTHSLNVSADSIRQSHWVNLLPFPDTQTLQTLAALVTAVATLTQRHPKLRARNAAHRVSVPAITLSTGECGVYAGSGSLHRSRRAITRPSQEISIHISSIRSDLNLWGDIWSDKPTCRVYTANCHRQLTHVHILFSLGGQWESVASKNPAVP